MSLQDKVAEPRKRPIHGLPCSIGALLETLEGAERDALVTMLGSKESPGWSAAEVYNALTAEGHPVGYQTVNRHRGGACRCGR